jgi:SAM-dependent methyltransferase
MTIADLEIMSNAPAYRRWMFENLKEYLGGRILEVGGGIGNFTEFLLDRQLVVTVDVLQRCVDYMTERFSDFDNVVPARFDIQNSNILRLQIMNFDTVVCLNVLEHVEDDVEALRIMNQLLCPDGRLVLLVPAYQFLYGTVDRSLKHCRRYSRKGLIAKLQHTDFRIEHLCYMNLLGVFGWFYNNRLVHRKEESTKQVVFFDRAIVPWLSRIEKRVRPPFGLSLVSISRKRQGSNPLM